MKDNSVYQIVTSRIISLLEKGTIPWRMPFRTGGQPPQNLITRKPYRGINTLLLSSLGYSCPFWVTFRQANELGGFVRRNERACPVIFWTWLEIEDPKTHEKDRFPVVKYYNLFNAVGQCEGVPVPTVSAPVQEQAPVRAAKDLLSKMPNPPEVRFGMAQAYYSLAQDVIGLPNPEDFISPEEFYCTLAHETIHSTAHPTRLDRTWSSREDAYWRDKEELIAELGGSFLSAEAGIMERTIDNSASYISSWLRRLKNDSRFVVQAAAQAQKAADYILNRQPQSATSSESQIPAMAA